MQWQNNGDSMRDIIRNKMREQKISVTEMSRRTGISRVSMSRYLNDRSDLGSRKFLLILAELGMIIINREDAHGKEVSRKAKGEDAKGESESKKESVVS